MTRDNSRTERLLQAILAERSADREAGVSQLAELPGCDSAVPLMVAIADVSRPVRAAARAALQRLGDGDIVNALHAALHGDAASTRALSRFGPDPDPRIFDALNIIMEHALQRLRRYTIPTVPCLHSRGLLCRAIGAMGWLGDPRAVPPVQSLIRLHDRDVRIAGAMALGRLQASGSIPYLVRLLRTRDAHVRYYVEEALNLLGEGRLVRALRAVRNGDITDDPSGGVLALIAEGDQRVLPPVRALLRQESDLYCRMRAVIVLCAAGEPGIEGEVRKLTDMVVDGLYSEDDDEIEGCEQFIAVLVEAVLLSGVPRGCQTVAELLADEAYLAIYRDLLALIVRRRPIGAAPCLVELLSRPPVWLESFRDEYLMDAVDALEQLADVRSLPALAGVANDPDHHLELRAHAARAYARLTGNSAWSTRPTVVPPIGRHDPA